MTTTIEKFYVLNRWTRKVQFTAEISVTPDMLPSVKLGLAVQWGIKEGADLTGAVLRGAVLRGADLTGAVLTGAVLTGADLTGADLTGAVLTDAVLTGAVLRSLKADLWFILTMARREVPALVRALKSGNVNGSTYVGDCACLVGTLENAGAAGLPHTPSSPAEQWFAMIRMGDKPGDDSPGGYASGKALEWTLEYCALAGIELPEASHG